MSQQVPENSSSVAERREPMRELEQVAERMRNFLDQTFGLQRPLSDGRSAWSPSVDVEESDGAYVIEADLPGVKREDTTVEVVGNELDISGEMKEREHTGTVRRQMRRTGRFAYQITLPSKIDGDKIEANLADGVLTVRVPKAEQDERHQIEVKA